MGGKVYDLTEFAAKHPGGSTMIYLAAGREVTDLFAMYHVFNEESARKFIKPYEIGVLDGPAEFGGFPVEPKGGFYDTLKTRVKAHFEAAKQDPRDPLPALLRMVPTFIVAFATFAAIHHPYFALPFAAKLLLSVVYGIAQALPLLHLMHDCSHGSLTKAGWVWDVVGQFVFDWFAGGSMAAWHHQHVLGHHVYTNVYGSDPDLPTREVRSLLGSTERVRGERHMCYARAAHAHARAHRHRCSDIGGLLGIAADTSGVATGGTQSSARGRTA